MKLSEDTATKYPWYIKDGIAYPYKDSTARCLTMAYLWKPLLRDILMTNEMKKIMFPLIREVFRESLRTGIRK